jgi:hypothetical protein
MLEGATCAPVRNWSASPPSTASTLREVLNYLWKQRQVITYNPVYAVELEPEVTPGALHDGHAVHIELSRNPCGGLMLAADAGAQKNRSLHG